MLTLLVYPSGVCGKTSTFSAARVGDPTSPNSISEVPFGCIGTLDLLEGGFESIDLLATLRELKSGYGEPLFPQEWPSLHSTWRFENSRDCNISTRVSLGFPFLLTCTACKKACSSFTEAWASKLSQSSKIGSQGM